ncbi:MAG: shikimate dehydrogenase [Candidatus Omnitrophota bacterium]
MRPIDSTTAIYGIIGYPVSHTFSPAMHNAAFAKVGLNCAYLAFCVRPDRLKSSILGMRGLGIAGVNVTVPHKEMVIPLLDELSREAKLVGAVNTIVVEGDRLIGHNTDGRGFVLSLKRDLRIEPKKKSVFIIGAGGAAKAISFQLAIEGARYIYLTDIAKDKAQRLVTLLNKNMPSCHAKLIPNEAREMERTVADADILINATPCGMKKHDPLLLNPKSLHSKLVVCDLIYNPPLTSLLKAARSRKLKIMNGLGMLLYQGAMSFYLWTKKHPPVDIMRRALLQEMRRSR